MKTQAVVCPTSAALTPAGVQGLIDSLVTRFAEQPRGFARAWCETLPPSVVGRAAYDDDWRMNTFVIPAGVTVLAAEDARLIAKELSRDFDPKLLVELETACALGNVHIETIAPNRARHGTRAAPGQDVAEYYRGLDEAATRWHVALARRNEVGGYCFDELARKHHARLIAAEPLAHDTRCIAAIAGARVALEVQRATKAAEVDARRISPDDSARIVEVFTRGTRYTVAELTGEQVEGVISRLAASIDAGNAGAVRLFMQHFREGVSHGGVTFASRAILERFLRGEFEVPLRVACAAHGLDYRDYNGIFDIDRFMAFAG